MSEKTIRPRPLPARERRRILRARIITHLGLLLALFLLADSPVFLGKNTEALGSKAPKAKSAKPEKITNENKKKDEEAGNLVSKETLNLIQYFEGYNPTCVDWLDGHATIGYGNLLHFGPCTEADNTLYVTKKEASETLSTDLLAFQDRVQDLVRVPINNKIEAALISFSYNVGGPALQKSTLLALLNARDYQSAADQFDLWINGPNGPLPGLVKRREIEKDLFLRGVKRLDS